jgi:hypothetical protein
MTYSKSGAMKAKVKPERSKHRKQTTIKKKPER